MNCGDCTACCLMFPIPEIGKPSNMECPHSCGGCSIHSSKPQLCTDFECAYYQSEVPIELRPDKCGIIFSRKNDQIFSGVLVSGVAVSDAAKGQVESFNKQGFSVVLVSVVESRPLVFPAKGQSATEILQEYAEVIGGDVQH